MIILSTAIKRALIVLISLGLQIAISLTLLLYLGDHYTIIEVIYTLLSFLIVVNIIKESDSLSIDMPWIIIIAVMPIVGALLYIILGSNLLLSGDMRRIVKSSKNSKKYLKQDDKITKEIEKEKLDQLKYISNTGGFPVTKRNKIKYYSMADDGYKTLLRELNKAEKYIFLESFIINNGEMWQEVLKILIEKARQGIDVRIMYDDFGSLSLPVDYPQELEFNDIKCVVFNKLNVFSSVLVNNRDHRKILIIDGNTVISGGFNFSDEYINKKERFGLWKDSMFILKGDAVWNYTVMFLGMWNSYRKDDNDFLEFKYDFKNKYPINGYTVPYGDSPLDREQIGENIYLNIINQAKEYVYIFTPYLILDTTMSNALILAAKRGVDIKIVVPGIPDKKITYQITKSYFESLINNGINIYTFTPGFIHSKVFVSDDKIATVGSVNMDYRSFYHHFECGMYMQDVNCIKDIKKDVEETITKSHKVTKKEASPGVFKSIWEAILRLIAPLM